ncbi:hypothetical protein [Sphingomonas japonica]|uniref:Uncharacterized protein n=1 Tax=Sphingomonas japonica TaxID=511662 RepID=A0ABX0U2B0_9SPHN|nr:hypothetical protein [Sphingomonas japonica]NIJ24628.1 hypothetical protein [Sphingomonas japonica]
MLHFYDRAGFARALTLDLEPQLQALLARRIAALSDELLDYTEYLVVEAGDSEDDIVRAIGLSPLIEPMHGLRFNDPGFEPHWDLLIDHGAWFEIVFTFGSTFAYVLFVQNIDGVPEHFLALCRRHGQ